MKKTVLGIILGLAASGTLFAQDGDRHVPTRTLWPGIPGPWDL